MMKRIVTRVTQRGQLSKSFVLKLEEKPYEETCEHKQFL